MKEHLIQLRVSTRMDLETLIKNFPPTLMIKNPEEVANSKGNFPLEVVYIKKVIKVAEQI